MPSALTVNGIMALSSHRNFPTSGHFADAI